MTDEEVSTVLSRPVKGFSTTATKYRLSVTEGPDRGCAFELGGAEPSRIFVGKSPVCDLRLKDPRVSRRHAAFETRDTELHLVDLGSSNGTFVNGVCVVDAILRGGETIRVGETVLRAEVIEANARIELSSDTSFGRVTGESPEMRRLYERCKRLAASDVSILIEGETGTGKEVLAEALHEASTRAQGPFVVFDCTAVPPSLLESELFGHERGAFTGAVSTRTGVFEQAHGGTLLIDEIGELDAPLQPKLLRALERSEVRRVGGDRWIKVDVRILAATRRDLDREVQDGRFRDDLFFRVAVSRVELPPLRNRRSDIAVLTRLFWQEFGGQKELLPYELIERFERYAWPGNVRELANAVAGYLALGEDSLSDRATGEAPRDSLDVIEAVLAMRLPMTRARQRVVADFERRYVERVLAEHGGSVAHAAGASGLARRYFNVLMARYKRSRERADE